MVGYLAEFRRLSGQPVLAEGAQDFWTVGVGKTADEAFHAAVEKAGYEHGHGGYTGSIAEKDGFILITDTAAEVKQNIRSQIEKLKGELGPVGTLTKADAALVKKLTKEQEKLQARLKEIAAQLNPLMQQTKPSWDDQERLRKIEQLQHTLDKLTDKPEAIANALMMMNDPRVDDKWGPAGAIELGPAGSGKKRFLFFGMASS